MNEHDWFEHAYDEIVSVERDGIEQDKLRDALARDYLDAVDRGEVEPPSAMDHARAKADQYMRPIRRKRKASFRKDIEHLLDALNDETILGADDPQLQQAVPVGNGRDKKLAFWTAEDWMTAVNVRQQNVQRAAEAATELSELATAAISAMSSRNAAMFGDMYVGAVAS